MPSLCLVRRLELMALSASVLLFASLTLSDSPLADLQSLLPSPCEAIQVSIQRQNSTVQHLTFPHAGGTFNSQTYNVTSRLVLAPAEDIALCGSRPTDEAEAALYRDSIMIVQRGGGTDSDPCTFVKKLYFADKYYNAAGLIIADVTDATESEIMRTLMRGSSDDDELSIPAVLASHSTWDTLTQLLQDQAKPSSHESAIVSLNVTLNKATEVPNEAAQFNSNEVDPLITQLSILLPLLAAACTLVIFALNYRQWRDVQQMLADSGIANNPGGVAAQPVVAIPVENVGGFNAVVQPAAAVPHPPVGGVIQRPLSPRQNEQQQQAAAGLGVSSVAPVVPSAVSYQGHYRSVAAEDDASSHADSSNRISVATPSRNDSVASHFDPSSSSDDADDLFDADSWKDMSMREKAEECLLQFTQFIGRPQSILYLNMGAYCFHVLCAGGLLMFGYTTGCDNALQSLVAMFLLRAVVGSYVTFWQTHSSQHFPVPNAALVFTKNWADYIVLFSSPFPNASMGPLLPSSTSPAHVQTCSRVSSYTATAVQCWVILIYISFATRLALFILLKVPACSIAANSRTAEQQQQDEQQQQQQQNAVEQGQQAPDQVAPQAGDQSDATHTSGDPTFRHTLAVLLQNSLDLINAGFPCAGALDSNKPATILDLRHIPVRRFRTGMYAEEDSLCSICYCSYEPDERLRRLFCGHHFHKACVDQWLLQRNSCPLCRERCDAEAYQRRKKQYEEQKSQAQARQCQARLQQRATEAERTRQVRTPSLSFSGHHASSTDHSSSLLTPQQQRSDSIV